MDHGLGYGDTEDDLTKQEVRSMKYEVSVPLLLSFVAGF